eukprot:Lithocolla_globosa_v1_NODE_2976_length_1807_cov_8.549087.p1 type:complete len:191 gc:universal NODE_2976_length_1807_cov_8.549087:1395-823(-)
MIGTNPCRSQLVRQYSKFTTEEQAEASVTPSQVPPIFPWKLKALFLWLLKYLEDLSNPFAILIVRMDMALFALAMAVGRRGDDLTQINCQMISWALKDEALLFNVMFEKTVRDGSQDLFWVKKEVGSNWLICVIAAFKNYAATARKCNVDLSVGPLFRNHSEQALSFDRAIPKVITARFQDYLKQAGLFN